MFKVTSTDKAPAAIGPYSQAIEVNGFLFYAEVLKALLEKVIAKMDKDKYLSSVTFVEHQEIFKELGFSVEKEWKRYVKMNKEN